MKFYYKTKQIPEFLGLSAKQRDYVWEECVDLLLQHRKIRGFRLLMLFCIICGSFELSLLAGSLAPIVLVAIPLLAALGVYWHNIFWASRRRPQIAQFIQDHWQEIQLIPVSGLCFRGRLFERRKKSVSGG